MFALTLRELADLVAGELLLSDMPPLGGDQEFVRRIVLDSRCVRPGDIYWALPESDAPRFAEAAFLRSALGVVSEGRLVMPWAGAFSLQVPDTTAALETFALATREQCRGPVILLATEKPQPAIVPLIEAALQQGKAATAAITAENEIPLALWGLSPLAGVTLLACPPEKFLVLKILQLCRPNVVVINSHTFDAPLNDTKVVTTADHSGTGSSDLEELVLRLCEALEIERSVAIERLALHSLRQNQRQCHSRRECAVGKKAS